LLSILFESKLKLLQIFFHIIIYRKHRTSFLLYIYHRQNKYKNSSWFYGCKVRHWRINECPNFPRDSKLSINIFVEANIFPPTLVFLDWYCCCDLCNMQVDMLEAKEELQSFVVPIWIKSLFVQDPHQSLPALTNVYAQHMLFIIVIVATETFSA